MTEPNKQYFVEAVERALKVIEVLSTQRRALKLNDIVAATGMESSTAFRLLYTLETLGYVDRDDAKRYSLGAKILTHGLSALSFSHVVESAQPFVADLFDRCGETTDVAIRDGIGAVIVALCKAPSVTDVFYSVGLRLPLHCSAVGRALLSEYSPDQVRELLGEGPYWRMARDTKATFDELIAELDLARRQKYAVSDREVDVNFRGVAAPIRDATGGIIAAVSITVNSESTSREQLEARMAPLVISAAARISLTLGAPPWPGTEGHSAVTASLSRSSLLAEPLKSRKQSGEERT